MRSATAHIVIIEDEPVTRTKLASYFVSEGYRVSEAEDAAGMREIIARSPADVLMIDINLPDEDGLKLTREQRGRSDVGIILVTGRTDRVDRIIGLEMGADDYVTKPFDQRELLARVKNLIERVRRGRLAAVPSGVQNFAGWSLDLAQRTLQRDDGTFVELTRAEFKMLALLASHPGQVLDRARILNEISHRDWDAADRTVDVIVRRLRQKLGDDPRHPRMIVTSHGEGYLFSPKVEGV